MTEAQFRHALRLGLGRAILYAREHDVREFREIILDACLHCYSYDIQIDGTRAAYMYELVGFLPAKEYYFGRVLESLADAGDDWDAALRFEFAAHVASDGSEEAKRAMYAAYAPGPRMGEHLGILFLRMDGIQGFLFAAEKIGELLATKADETDTGFLLSQSIEICGEAETWDALRQASATNVAIERCRVAAEERHRATSPRAAPQEIPLTYEQLLALAPLNKPFVCWKWGEQASETELNLAAKGLLAAANSKQQLMHSRIFMRRPFPLDPAPLIALAEVEEDRVGFAALRALSQVSHPAVRELAFRRMASDVLWRGESVGLLMRNYQEGDHRIILHWLEEEDDPETRHSLGFDSFRFWEQHPEAATEIPMLRTLHERGPCSFCREKAVRRLLALGALTEEMRAECAWDANEDTRELVRQG